MWTNVFKIGGLSQISWFQFLPSESDIGSHLEKNVKGQEKDAATFLVLSSHLQLQKEGFLSTWSNSFVGPWDPSQGMHNPDEKIKLWLFLPGRRSSVVETAQAVVSRLRVVGSGLWVAPGDSEEVAAALSQALRNRIERALREISYIRFGDVFTRCHPCPRSEKVFRKLQPTIEFIFAANEEAIFVHAIIAAKHVRSLTSEDVEKVLRRRSSNKFGERLPVIVAPHGMRGRVTGCCPSDLVKQVYFSSNKDKASNGFSIPFSVAQGSGCQVRGQNCCVEVTLGCSGIWANKATQSSSNFSRDLPKNYLAESPTKMLDGGDQKSGPAESFQVFERTFICPAEAVLVPVVHTAFARFSQKSLWLQNWAGTSLFGSWFFTNCLGFGSAGNTQAADGTWSNGNGIQSQHAYNSSSNSNSSSIASVSSTSSESDCRMASEAGDLEADADSFTCRQSGLSSNDQFGNDGQVLVSKRSRVGTTESCGGAGTVINTNQVDNTATAGVAIDRFGSYWDWDDEDREEGLDIQILLSEFGDFGDFFESDVLQFGEPPGTAESQALVPASECVDVSSSPCTGMMDVTDHMLLPVLELPSLDNFNAPPPPPPVMEESHKKQELVKDTASGPGSQCCALSTGELDHLSKTEAMLTFALEYRAVETPASELSSSIFKSPYVPVSRRVDGPHSVTGAYVYSATPPYYGLNVSVEKVSVVTSPGSHDSSSNLPSKMYYIHVKCKKRQRDGKLLASANNMTPCDELTTSSSISGFNSTSAPKSAQKRKTESNIGAGNFLLSTKTVVATEIANMVFQVSMCRARHMLLSSSNSVLIGPSRLTTSMVLDPLPGDQATMHDKTSGRFEVKKKESIPVRIAGDVDGGMLDGPLSAPIGVWRSVGVSKGAKPMSSLSFDNNLSFHHSSFLEENKISYGQRQPLEEFLDGMAFLVQQATSFVDVALDIDSGDGPYGWLALQEQCSRGFSCGPSATHAGCGGLLSACHSLDIAGVQLQDPLSASVHSSSMITLLHSDIKVALKSAFGNLDGPLSVTDYCKGRNSSGDVAGATDPYSIESSMDETKDPPFAVSMAVGEPNSPTQTSGSSTGIKDGLRVDEASQKRLNQDLSSSETEHNCSRLRPTLFVLPLPALLVGYQDDWLKTSASSLQLWEKAPFEPYAQPKPMNYCVICPNIDFLTSAAGDFFQLLGTVYEACKLGTHTPQNMGGQVEMSSGKLASSGFVLVECPQSMKIESGNASIIGSISDYLLALSNGWELKNYLKSLSNVIKALRLGPSSMTNQKEGNCGPGMVVYVVCPFPDPIAVLHTVIESSTALGSMVLSSEKERRSILHAQVGKALSGSTAVDEASISNILTLSGFNISKLVLQIVPVEAILRVTGPTLTELVLLKEIAFTVYNKARRVSRISYNDATQSSTISGRPQSTLMHLSSNIPGMWKDCVTPRITGSLSREGELDAGMRPPWDNSWLTSRSGGLSSDFGRPGDNLFQEDIHYLFEPLFILAEPGSVELGVSPLMLGNATSESLKQSVDESSSGGFMQSSTSGSSDIGVNSMIDGEMDGFGSGLAKAPSLHCCYGWTEDWRWLVCIWTDSRGELLDSHIFPFGGISSRQDTKGLQCLFVQVLQQGCQIISSSSADIGAIKPRDIVITRIGCFFELERQEWQKAISFIGGSDVKKWNLQLRRAAPDGISASSNGNSLHQQEMSLIQERNLPSSPSSSLYSPQPKGSGFIKGGLGQTNSRKQLMGGQQIVDSSRGMFQWVQSISLIGVSVDHSLHLNLPADSAFPGGGTLGSSSTGSSNYVEGFSSVKSLGSMPASYILIPSPSMRFLPPTPLQLPTCLTSESPPLAHLLHSKGSAIPLSTGFVVSKAVPSVMKDHRSSVKERPSIISVSLVDYYGGSNIIQEKIARGKQSRNLSLDVRDHEIETHLILETLAAELHALSWMTVSPAFLDRRTLLPFHCDMILRLRRLLHFADMELSKQRHNAQS
ncbi:hypothetical protein Scep_026442 [Stephania cephalantha]|uniref:Mediator of RNA polymerase II transcription subunit 13 n=1 Tax=Stephania cephalantha TaxID=152367 RepID=A0AAP0ESF2_9MAGN